MASNSIPDSLIQDWFSLGKTVPRQVITTYTANHGHYTDDDSSSVSSFRKSKDTDYASYPRAQQLEEERRVLQDHASDCESTVGDRMSSLHLNRAEVASSYMDTTLGDDPIEGAAEVYTKYDMEPRFNPKLVISSYRKKITDMIDINQVTVIRGSTGSGKTTQVPQFILDKYASEGAYCNIVVTQPRRIAAMSIARRVCTERNWKLGGLVGYQIGLDNQTSEETRLCYVTTGVLLQRLIMAKHMTDYTHVILDEAHERDQDMDFLLLVVRKLSRTVSKGTKVILMSATVDTGLFSAYFTTPCGNRMVHAPVLQLQGKNYPIYDFWVDQLSIIGQVPELDASDPKLTPQAVNLAQKLIVKFDEIEREEQCEKNKEFASDRGTVLAFLPGIEEINEMYKALDDLKINMKWTLMPLHSSITWDEQRKVFDVAQPGYRKIILATNIAESSITVPDIKFVIDFCLTKNLVCDPQTNYTWLQLEWASRSNCIQRMGRAGRVSKGRVYRMVTSEFYENVFQEYSVPEMRRCPLDKVVLHAKMLDMGEPKAILGLAIDPPDLSDIERTILVLMEVGALASKCNAHGIAITQDGNLTYVGRVVAKLPVDIHLGKLMVLGHAFGCLEDCIIIAAGLSQKSIFATPYNQQLQAYKNKLAWADGSFSDCIAITNVYKIWQIRRKSGWFRRPGGTSEREWGRSNYVQVRRLQDVEKLVIELTKRLANMGIRPPHHHRKSSTEESKREDILILKLVIAGAFYPHYFMQASLDEKQIDRAVCGHNPRSTVFMTGLPIGQGILYQSAVEAMLSECISRPQMYFEHSKVYIEFDRSTVSMQNVAGGMNEKKFEVVASEVYLAVKMRLLRLPLELRQLPSDVAAQRMEQLGLNSEDVVNPHNRLRTSMIIARDVQSQFKQVQLPRLNQSTISFRATDVIDCGHFWAQYAGQDSLYKMDAIKDQIDANISLGDVEVTGPVTPGMLCLAPFKEIVVEYYRVRVESISGATVEVFFVDYGNRELVQKSDLREINRSKFPELITIPMQAFECMLSNFGPSLTKCPDGTWTPAAKRYFMDAIQNKDLYGRVYSVVHNIVRLEIIFKDNRHMDVSLNECMKREGFAINAVEGSYSIQNNELRRRAHHDRLMSESVPSQNLVTNLPDDDMSTLSATGRKIRLGGPYSPLETSFFGLTRSSEILATRIERDSVNSVTLDCNPEDKHGRLLVASDINLNQTGDSIVARSTTFLPNIHGLLPLVIIVFSPRVEFRSDKNRKRYIGALCGLGYDESTGQSLYPEHDMDIVFDTEITQDDIITINKVRIGLNMLLNSDEEPCEENAGYMYDIQAKLRLHFLRLICCNHRSVKPLPFSGMYKWGCVDPAHLLHPELDGTDAHALHVLPLLSAIELNVDHTEHIRQLHSIASKSMERQDIYCQLCRQEMSCPRDLVLHLQMQRHRELEMKAFDSSKNKKR